MGSLAWGANARETMRGHRGAERAARAAYSMTRSPNFTRGLRHIAAVPDRARHEREIQCGRATHSIRQAEPPP